MKFLFLLPVFFCLSFTTLESGTKSSDELLVPVTDKYDCGVSDAEIHTFMETLIAEGFLDTSLYLASGVQNIMQDGEIGEDFLKQFVKLEKGEKFITKKDVSFMMQQRIRGNDFKWDTQRYGFASEWKEKWYQISLPYFSKDKQSVIIEIGNCYKVYPKTAQLFHFKKESGKWVRTQLPRFGEDGC